MKTVLAFILLFVSATGFCMEQQQQGQVALGELQKLGQLAEEQKKESELREKEKLELRKRALVLKEQRLALEKRKVRALEVIAILLANKFMDRATDPKAKAKDLKEKLQEVGIIVPEKFLESEDEFNQLITCYQVMAPFLIKVVGPPEHLNENKQEK